MRVLQLADYLMTMPQQLEVLVVGSEEGGDDAADVLGGADESEMEQVAAEWLDKVRTRACTLGAHAACSMQGRAGNRG